MKKSTLFYMCTNMSYHVVSEWTNLGTEKDGSSGQRHMLMFFFQHTRMHAHMHTHMHIDVPHMLVCIYTTHSHTLSFGLGGPA